MINEYKFSSNLVFPENGSLGYYIYMYTQGQCLLKEVTTKETVFMKPAVTLFSIFLNSLSMGTDSQEMKEKQLRSGPFKGIFSF